MSPPGAITPAEFAAAMASLQPFEPAPRLAAGVSGGADSMALAVLANEWAKDRCGSLLALVVDHGLRPDSRQEAVQTAERLGALGIAAKLLPTEGLTKGPALAERARLARYGKLQQACRQAGILHLLLGHHGADQAETLLIRSLSGSGPAGMAAMLPLVELTWLRLLRPLLEFPPVRLRSTLVARGIGWIEDPSNQDIKALRPRLRRLRHDRDGLGSSTVALAGAAAAARLRRAEQGGRAASDLTEQFRIHPEGFALWTGRPVSPTALAALFQAVAGATYPPGSRSVAALAVAPRPATAAGIRLVPAGRCGPGLLVVREAASMAAPVPALPNAVWDGRFRLGAGAKIQAGAVLGPLGRDAAGLRRASPLPSVVLQTLPAIRVRDQIVAVPHLNYPDSQASMCWPLIFNPVRSAVVASFPFGDA